MTHRGEEHSSEAVGSAPTAASTATLSAESTPWGNGAPALPASLWPSIYHRASPDERARLIQAAQADGLLYADRLPGASALDLPHQPLGALLDGNADHLPPAARAGRDVEFIDQELDAEQRAAVAGILATPDVFLLQGHAGSGKTRVLVETLRQAIVNGQRVLLLARGPAAVDRVLLALQGSDKLHVLRCRAADEDEAQLPPSLRDCTLQAQRRILEQESLPCARHARDEAARICQAIERDLQSMDGLRRLASAWRETTARRSQLRHDKDRALEVVREDAERPLTPSADDDALPRLLERERQRHAARIQELQAALATAEADLRVRQQARVQKFEQVHQQELVVETKQARRYWNWLWWRSLFQGRAAERLAEFQTLAAEADAGFQSGQKAVQELQSQHEQETKRHAVAIEQILANELASRLADLDAKLLVVDQELQALRESWHAAAAGLRTLAIPNSPEAAAELETNRQSLDEAFQAARASLDCQAKWLEALEVVVPSLTDHLLAYANVVAGTPDELVHQGVHATGVAPPAFDWLVVVGAEELTSEHLIRWTRHARRWLLCGQPVAAFGKPVESSWHRLWRTLRGIPSRWPHHWVEDRNFLVCRRVRLSDAERSLLETERLVDQPDVELRIVPRPASRPVLAEIAFPRERYSIAAAKTYVYQQLGELTLQADPLSGRWSVRGGQVCFELREGDHDDELALTLEPGIREILRAPAGGETNGQIARACDTLRLEFDRAAGWDRSQAERWLSDRVGLVDLGRTRELRRTWRVRPEMVHFWNEALFTDLTTSTRTSGDAFLFVNVTPPKLHRRTVRTERGRYPEPSRNSASLEIDLADSRQRQTLPFDLQLHLPARGLVNLVEAETVMTEITKLLTLSNGQELRRETEIPSLAVLAWHAPQALLLQALWKRAKHVNPEAVRFGHLRDAAPLMADYVLLSLAGRHELGPARIADRPGDWQQALMTARRQLVLVGELSALQRLQETKTPADRSWERALVSRLLRHVEAGDGMARPALVRQGVPA